MPRDHQDVAPLPPLVSGPPGRPELTYAQGAFSNPRMSLKWAKAEKVSLLGEDLLSKG